MKKTGSESDASSSPSARARLLAEVAKQRVRIAKEELKRARKRLKEAKREARRARKGAAVARKAWKHARRAQKGSGAKARKSGPAAKARAVTRKKVAVKSRPPKKSKVARKKPVARRGASPSKRRAPRRAMKVAALGKPRVIKRVAANAPKAGDAARAAVVPRKRPSATAVARFSPPVSRMPAPAKRPALVEPQGASDAPASLADDAT